MIERLPSECTYSLCVTSDCGTDNLAELEVFPEDNRAYYQIASDWKFQPETPEEIQFVRGILRVVIYVPGAWEERT